MSLVSPLFVGEHTVLLITAGREQCPFEEKLIDVFLKFVNQFLGLATSSCQYKVHVSRHDRACPSHPILRYEQSTNRKSSGINLSFREGIPGPLEITTQFVNLLLLLRRQLFEPTSFTR